MSQDTTSRRDLSPSTCEACLQAGGKWTKEPSGNAHCGQVCFADAELCITPYTTASCPSADDRFAPADDRFAPADDPYAARNQPRIFTPTIQVIQPSGAVDFEITALFLACLSMALVL